MGDVHDDTREECLFCETEKFITRIGEHQYAHHWTRSWTSTRTLHTSNCFRLLDQNPYIPIVLTGRQCDVATSCEQA